MILANQYTMYDHVYIFLSVSVHVVQKIVNWTNKSIIIGSSDTSSGTSTLAIPTPIASSTVTDKKSGGIKRRNKEEGNQAHLLA